MNQPIYKLESELTSFLKLPEKSFFSFAKINRAYGTRLLLIYSLTRIQVFLKISGYQYIYASRQIETPNLIFEIEGNDFFVHKILISNSVYGTLN